MNSPQSRMNARQQNLERMQRNLAFLRRVCGWSLLAVMIVAAIIAWQMTHMAYGLTLDLPAVLARAEAEAGF